MMILKKLLSIIVVLSTFCSLAEAKVAARPWKDPVVPETVSENILYVPIADESVKSLKIKESREELVDLLEVHNPRLKTLAFFDSRFKNTYVGYSKVRKGVYERLEAMLKILPANIGIAYFEGFRPLAKQKENFDNKFKEILLKEHDKESAYQETAKHVSPFIDNIPTHATGASIDIALFEITKDGEKLLEMGKFDFILGENDQQETFSENTTPIERKNRLILLEAATKAGFVNYGYEWWHYSYGDKAWAFVKGKKEAIYGLKVNPDDPILSIDKETYLKGF